MPDLRESNKRKKAAKPRPHNQVDIKFYTTPPSLSLEEAAAEVKRQKPQIHYAISTYDLNFGEIDGVVGKRVIIDQQWTDFKAKCKAFDKLNK